MELTYQELLNDLDDVYSQNSEFIEINKMKMVNAGPMNEQDYQYFWGCMKIYDAYGVNYFGAYLDLLLGFYGNYSNGIESWIKEDVRGAWHNYSFIELVETLRFFGISSYQGISLQDFEKALAVSSTLYRSAEIELQHSREEKRKKTITTKVNDYFNFGDFSEFVFNNYLEKFTLNREKKSISIDDALKLAQESPVRTYIVVFSRLGQVCYVGKTDNPLSYIALKHKKFNADSVIFDAVDDIAYIDDLLLAIMIFYDLPLNTARTTKANRKYATIKQACFAYQKLESWPKKKILSVIENSKLRIIDMDLERSLIDKIELERALRKASYLL